MTTASDRHPVARALGILLPLLILACAIGVSIYLIKTKPVPATRPPQERAALVETMVACKTNAPIRIRAAGTVVPDTEITLQPELSGRVTALHPDFEPGATFRKDDILVEIEPHDYALVVTTRKAELAKAEAAFRLERGYQDVASQEWELIPDREKATELDRELALRKPQLMLAEANRDAARAALEQAELNLSRTTVRAPFNGVVRERHVNVGTQVNSQTVLAQLAGTDAFWIIVTVPVSDLRWIGLPEDPDSPGPPVTVRNAGGLESTRSWQGRVIRRLPDLENAGRMAQLLVSVPEPLKHPGQPLLLGAYVDVTIEGSIADSVVVVPRSAYRDGNVVWIRNPADGRMQIRPVEPLWGNQHEIYIRVGLEGGEQLVTSDLGTPVAGMRLSVAGEQTPPTNHRPQPNGTGNGGAEE